MDPSLLLSFALALGLGLLVGLERESAEPSVAGIRTFPLITFCGALCGLLGGEEAWLPAAGLLAVATLLWIGNRMRLAQGPEAADAGLTTETAALVMFLVGAALTRDHTALAVVVSGSTAALLHLRQPLHAFVHRLGEDDLRALGRLVLIGMVILPVLPNRGFGPDGVLNPWRIWLMVVLIVGISLAAYIARRLMGPTRGALVAGLLGGLISSTATTVSFARRSRAASTEATRAAVVIVLASAVVFGRVLVEVAMVAPALLATVGPPLALMMVLAAGLAFALFVRHRPAVSAGGAEHAPAELRAAIAFGALYGVVLLAVAVVQERFGTTGLYAVAGLSGLADMDAITLSTAELMRAETLPLATGWRLILVAAMANLVFKGAVVAALGTPELRRGVLSSFAVCLAAGAGLLIAWPR